MSKIITKEILKTKINEILKHADLTETSAKKVRQELETTLNCSLISRKKEIDEIVMEFVNLKEHEESECEESEDEDIKDEPVEKKMKKDDTESDSDHDKPPPKPKRGGRKSKANDEDEDTGVRKTRQKAKKPRLQSSAPRKKGTGFTRPYTLSPELANLMGAEALPRHEVVKKMWQFIKERNLYDPKNKQFAICDPDLLKVMGVKRFRTFGMLKYLRSHFID